MPYLETRLGRQPCRHSQRSAADGVELDLVSTITRADGSSGGPQLALPGLAIVETKSSSTPSAADRRLWRHGHRPTRVSKYGTGLAALHEHLPANKWHPVLRRHFAPHVPEILQERTAS